MDSRHTRGSRREGPTRPGTTTRLGPWSTTTDPPGAPPMEWQGSERLGPTEVGVLAVLVKCFTESSLKKGPSLSLNQTSIVRVQVPSTPRHRLRK